MWWTEHKYRMIQNNLRDIDAGMDVDFEVAMLKKLHANVVQLGCGGITAFSQTTLGCQKKSPFLQGDKFGELLTKCHENNIRVIARFDVSKVHVDFEKTHPEWLVHTAEGKHVYYNDTVVTCVNSDYEQNCTLEILKDILDRYPVDGIFFNMFGYPNNDYSGRYIGFCHCENCIRRFKEMYGEEIPAKEDHKDPVWHKYEEFKRVTVNQLLEKIHDFVKASHPEVAISTYFDQGIDIVRMESNTAVDRPLPLWIYHSSDNVACVEDTFADKVSSNVCINAVDLRYRFMGVPDSLNRIRLMENIANRGNLDWCIIGSFDGYTDTSNWEGVEEIYGFHEKWQDVYDKLSPAAKILLLQPVAPYRFGYSEEFRGIFRMLKEAHIPFDTLIDVEADHYGVDMEQYSLVILPGIRKFKSEKVRSMLKNTRAKILATAGSLSEDPELLGERFGIFSLSEKTVEITEAAYFRTEPKSLFTSFPKQEWLYLHGPRLEAAGAYANGMVGILPLVNPATFGPPERAFGHTFNDTPGALFSEQSTYVLFDIGKLYYKQGYPAFRKALVDILDAMSLDHEIRPYTTNAHPSVETTYHKLDDNTACLHLINVSGNNGVMLDEIIPQHGILFTFHREVDSIEELTLKESREVPADGGVLAVSELVYAKVYLIHYKA